jgi:hypothetical protein
MGRGEEDFAKGMGYKISSIPAYPNKFRNNCVDCGRNVFIGDGVMVKGEDHDKIKTVCKVCSPGWTSKQEMNNSVSVKLMKERHPNGPTKAGD